VRREASTHSSRRERKRVSDCSGAGYKAAGGRGGDGGVAEGGYAEGSDDATACSCGGRGWVADGPSRRMLSPGCG
jgi:hypothetical protein